MSNVISLVILIAIAALLVRSAIGAGRVNNRLLRWGAVGVAGLLAIVNFALAGLTVAGMYRQHARTATVPHMKIAGTPAQIQRGQAESRKGMEIGGVHRHDAHRHQSRGHSP
jgi:hypothetical protein